MIDIVFVLSVTPHKIKASTMTAKVLSSCVSHSIS